MQIRRVLTHELQQAAVLAENVFCADGDRYMESSFPALFQPGISHSYGAFTPEGILVSFMGMVPVQIQSGTHLISAYSIGAVCTHPDYRGQGFAGQLLDLCRQHARAAGASLLFISGDRSLYTRAGSVPFGQVTRFEWSADVAQAIPDRSSEWTYRDLLPQDIFAIADHIQQQEAHIKWGLGDLQQFIGAQPMANIHKQQQHIRVAETADHQIAGFVVFSIPHADVPDHERAGSVIESGGDPAVIYHLWTDALSQYELTSLTVRIPWQDQSLTHLLIQAGASPMIEQNGGTVLVIDDQALLTQTGLNNSAASPNLWIDIAQEGQYMLHTPSTSYSIHDSNQLYTLLFQPDTQLTNDPDFSFPTVPLPYMYGLYFI